ncbi:MAG: hypothetical protein NTV04_18045 [Deltaproteobacteria bacterium]|jgi:hypothetical protein|nr:hypothetical protein [Deltaproteobacteria bacterium]
MKKKEAVEKFTKQVRLFLSLDPLRYLEGTVTVPSSKARLSDMINDERTFLSIQNVVVPKEWSHCFSEFVLLNKREIRAIVEID